MWYDENGRAHDAEPFLPCTFCAHVSRGSLRLSLRCRWRFHLQELTDGHWVSVARGPPETIVDAWQEFTGTLKEPVIATARFQVSSTALQWVCLGYTRATAFMHAMHEAQRKVVQGLI